MTYNKSTTFKSLPGGLVTILTRFTVAAYLIYQLLSVFKKNSIVQNSSFRRDLTSDPTEYDLTQDIVDFALRLEYVGFADLPDV